MASVSATVVAADAAVLLLLPLSICDEGLAVAELTATKVLELAGET